VAASSLVAASYLVPTRPAATKGLAALFWLALPHSPHSPYSLVSTASPSLSPSLYFVPTAWPTPPQPLGSRRLIPDPSPFSYHLIYTLETQFPQMSFWATSWCIAFRPYHEGGGDSVPTTRVVGI
jgi:hypothetical protein